MESEINGLPLGFHDDNEGQEFIEKRKREIAVRTYKRLMRRANCEVGISWSESRKDFKRDSIVDPEGLNKRIENLAAYITDMAGKGEVVPMKRDPAGILDAAELWAQERDTAGEVIEILPQQDASSDIGYTG